MSLSVALSAKAVSSLQITSILANVGRTLKIRLHLPSIGSLTYFLIQMQAKTLSLPASSSLSQKTLARMESVL